MNSKWIFIDRGRSFYWEYPDEAYGDMDVHFGNTQRSISDLVAKLAIL